MIKDDIKDIGYSKNFPVIFTITIQDNTTCDIAVIKHIEQEAVFRKLRDYSRADKLIAVLEAIITYLYESYYERKERRVQKLLAPKIEDLIEISSMKIAKKQKALKRSLTEDEKNKICDECYSEI